MAKNDNDDEKLAHFNKLLKELEEKTGVKIDVSHISQVTKNPMYMPTRLALLGVVSQISTYASYIEADLMASSTIPSEKLAIYLSAIEGTIRCADDVMITYSKEEERLRLQKETSPTSLSPATPEEEKPDWLKKLGLENLMGAGGKKPPSKN